MNNFWEKFRVNAGLAYSLLWSLPHRDAQRQARPNWRDDALILAAVPVLALLGAMILALLILITKSMCQLLVAAMLWGLVLTFLSLYKNGGRGLAAFASFLGGFFAGKRQSELLDAIVVAPAEVDGSLATALMSVILMLKMFCFGVLVQSNELVFLLPLAILPSCVHAILLTRPVPDGAVCFLLVDKSARKTMGALGFLALLPCLWQDWVMAVLTAMVAIAVGVTVVKWANRNGGIDERQIAVGAEAVALAVMFTAVLTTL